MPSRLRKKIARSLMVSWRVQPNRYDIEALQANISRVGMVVRVRWILIVALIIYSFIGGALYLADHRVPVSELAQLMTIPAIALGFVMLYNTFYTLNYRRLGNITVWNHLQLALDALVVTVLVYYSGGASSWFWSIYPLFILEATFILPRSRDAWIIALGCVAMLGSVILLEMVGVLPHVVIPFADPELHTDRTYISVRFLWQATVLIGTASVATSLVGGFRRASDLRASRQLIDEMTGLYSRAYFLRTCVAEIRRSLKDGHEIHVILVDVDRLGDFNTRFGFDRGDEMLRSISEAIQRSVAEAGDLSVSSNVVARFGGEEFAVLLAEDERIDGYPTVADALRLAEKIRAAVAAVSVSEAGVTASVGVASAPHDGHSIDELLDVADNALACAVSSGGNRVMSARDCPVDGEGESTLTVVESGL